MAARSFGEVKLILGAAPFFLVAVITPEEADVWMNALWSKAKDLQKPGGRQRPDDQVPSGARVTVLMDRIVRLDARQEAEPQRMADDFV